MGAFTWNYSLFFHLFREFFDSILFMMQRSRRISRKLYQMPEGYDRLLHYTVIALSLFGVVMQVSASMDSTKVTMAKLMRTALKQIIIFVISYFGMVAATNYFNYTFLKKNYQNMVIGVGVLLIATLLGPTIGGSNGWIIIPIIGISIQPSEFAKLAMILIVASNLGDNKRTKGSWVDIMKKPFVIFAIYFFTILVLQRDFGSAMVLMLITAICCLIPNNSNIRQGQRIILMLLIAFIFLMLFLMSDVGLKILDSLPALKHQIVRFKAAANPFTNRYGTGYYDLVNSLIAFNTGGWTGVGLGKSLRKYGYISAAYSDFIMAVVAEELGMVGFLAVCAAYLLIVFSILRFAIKSENERTKVICVGIAMYFTIHFIFNVGGVTCLIPLTGIPLLLVSSGGSSSLTAMVSIGIVQSFISRQNRRVNFKGE